jgi:hypothetical protein
VLQGAHYRRYQPGGLLLDAIAKQIGGLQRGERATATYIKIRSSYSASVSDVMAGRGVAVLSGGFEAGW